MQNTLLDLTILALLVSLFGSVDHVAYDRRLRFWLTGWICVFLDLLLHVWTNPAHRLVLTRLNLHFDHLVLASLFFVFSFLPRSPWRHLVLLAARLMGPAALLVLVASVYPQNLWAIRVVIVLGQGIALIEARRVLHPGSPLRAIAQWIAATAGAFMLLSAPGLIPCELLAQLFLLNSVIFGLVYGKRRTRGVLAATAGLFTWAFAFPIRAILEDRSALRAASPVLGDLWDIPMLLTAFGMILILREENLARAAALHEEYRQLFDCHPLPMYIYNLETLRFVGVNEAAIHHYGYTAEEFAAMTVMDIRPAEDAPRLRKVLETERRQLNTTHGWRHTLKNGRIIDVEIYRHSTRFNGQPCNMIVALDVTERNAAEQRNRQAYKIESLGQLTGGIAHDFNNLLTILTTSLELIAQQDLDPPSRSLVEDAIHSVHTGVSLTRRLLTYASRQPLEAEVVRVEKLLDSMAPFLKAGIGTAITLQVTSAPGLWQSTVDPHQLESALLNLSLNARDAMPQGGSLRIAARNYHIGRNQPGPLGDINAGDYVLLTITDTGIGMPESVLSRATEPFFTTKPIGQGTGLGLNMVYGFLRQSGGSFQIESKPNAGTTIFLYLPRATPSGTVLIPQTIAATPIPRGSETILLVEDEPTIRHVLTLLLRSLGYTVLDANDGPSALAQLAATPGVSLLLTDVILPRGMDGQALAAQARTLYPALRILYSSGYTQDVLVRDKRISEDARLLTKPYHVTDLARELRLVLD